MKIALSRFRNLGSVGGTKYVEMPTGMGVRKFVEKFRFCYANLNQSINSQLSNLGNTQTATKMVATHDPRFKGYVDKDSADQVSINGNNYNITNVSVDDSDLVPVYKLTITKKDAN